MTEKDLIRWINPCIDISLRDYKFHCYVFDTNSARANDNEKCKGRKAVQKCCEVCPFFAR